MSKQYIYSLAGIIFFTLFSIQSHAAAILFAQVGHGSYDADGNQLANMLTADGHSVTTRFLSDGIYNDYDTFDQIFVYDLVTGTNSSSNQVANYTNIASWYNDRSDKNLILDGRIISSASFWTNSNGMSAEDAWIQSYASVLAANGGGLVLGTDHNSYQAGINTINDQIGIDPFSGFFGSFPSSQAVVDEASVFFINSLDPCRADTDTSCINDNSTTGFVATGVQANGQTLTPIAYHGSALDAWDQAAVSSTFGSSTFGTCGGPNQPPCINNGVPSPSPLVLLGLGLLVLGYQKKR